MDEWQDIEWWLDRFSGTEPLYSEGHDFKPKGVKVTFAYPHGDGSMAVDAELPFSEENLNLSYAAGPDISDEQVKAALTAGVLIVRWMGGWDDRVARKN